MMEVEFKAVEQNVVKDPISNDKSGPCLHRCFLVNQSIVLVFQYLLKPGSYINTELYFKDSTAFGVESGFQADVRLIVTNKGNGRPSKKYGFFLILAKGQLISKCLIGVIVSTKKPTKFL